MPAILGLIYLGSETIFFAFFQLTTIGYLVSYFIPILLVFLRRELLPPAYWRMPNGLAKFCNVVSLLYVSSRLSNRMACPVSLTSDLFVSETDPLHLRPLLFPELPPSDRKHDELHLRDLGRLRSDRYSSVVRRGETELQGAGFGFARDRGSRVLISLCSLLLVYKLVNLILCGLPCPSLAF